MKIIFLTLVVFIVTHVQAEPTQAQKQSIVMRQQWDNDLNSYLINHEDANIAMFGLYRAALGNKQVADIAETLNLLLENETLSTQSLFLAADVCSRDDMLDLCDVQSSAKKLIESDPTNLAVYLNDLNLAVKAKDDKKTNTLLEKMAQSHNSDIYYYLPEKLENIIESYVTLNSIDDRLKQSELDQLKQLQALTDSGFTQIQNNYQQYQITSTLLSFKLILPFPNFRNLVNKCKKDDSNEKNCLQIALVMTKGKSFISNAVGRSIKMEIYKANDNQSKYQAALVEKEKVQQQMKCISKINAQNSFFDTYFNLGGYKAFSKVERSQGEFAAFASLADSYYHKQIKNNQENATDPATCFDL